MKRFPLVESYRAAAEVSAVASCPTFDGRIDQPAPNALRRVQRQTPWMGSEVLA
jgi:hypothetical protein